MKTKLHNNQTRDEKLRKMARLDHARRVADENEERFERIFSRTEMPDGQYNSNSEEN